MTGIDAKKAAYEKQHKDKLLQMIKMNHSAHDKIREGKARLEELAEQEKQRVEVEKLSTRKQQVVKQSSVIRL